MTERVLEDLDMDHEVLERENKTLQARFNDCLHRIDELESKVGIFEEQLRDKNDLIEDLRKEGKVVLWDREKKKILLSSKQREEDLGKQIEHLKIVMEEQKLASQKTLLSLQTQLKKSELKVEMGSKLTEDEFHSRIESLKKDLFQQKLCTAKVEKERRKQVELFTGFMRGLRLDLRILMEQLESEAGMDLGTDEEAQPLKGFVDLMSVMDEIQYACSKDAVRGCTDTLPAHYSTIEAGMSKLASHVAVTSNSASVPSSPASSPLHPHKVTARSLTTTPQGKRNLQLPPLKGSRSRTGSPECIRHGPVEVHKAPLSLPGSPLHPKRFLSRKLPTVRGPGQPSVKHSPPSPREAQPVKKEPPVSLRVPVVTSQTGSEGLALGAVRKNSMDH